MFIAAQDEICTWAALSYCWGGGSDFRLTTKIIIDDIQIDMPLRKFPQILIFSDIFPEYPPNILNL